MSQGLRKGHTLQGGTYRIEKVLGNGSFGITYLANAKFTTHGNLGSMDVVAQVAIKEFFMGDVNTRNENGSSIEGSTGNVFTNYRKKFRREAENLSKLSHENIVKVLDVFDENNTTYYVMEFIEGTNLDDYITEQGGLPEEEAVAIIKEIGEAIAYMHKDKMLHLDIKPKNIMRKSNGKYYLIDFGLSKQFTEDGEPESSTSIGGGTPGYSPIEQSSYRQDGGFPATLDVYALGATMYKILTGKRPPEATNILNEGFPREEFENIDISAHTLGVLEKAMEPVKRKRYKTIREFLDKLDSQESEETVFPGNDSPTGNADEGEETVIESPKKTDGATNKGDSEKEGNDNGGNDNGSYDDGVDGDDGGSDGSDYGLTGESSSNKSGSKKWWIIIAACFLLCAIGGVIWITDDHSTKKTPSQQYTALTEMPSGILIVDSLHWESPLGGAVYSGCVIYDTLGREVLVPHGKGSLEILEGKYEGNHYEGEFDYGNLEGKSSYVLKNGDVFVGRFKENKYERGRYRIKESGEYFEGTFKDGQPDKGYWFNKNGDKI